MKSTTITPTDLASTGSILALASGNAARALASLHAGGDMAEALDGAYGKGKWFVFWDEDLRGRPVRGTISLAFGTETLVIG